MRTLKASLVLAAAGLLVVTGCSPDPDPEPTVEICNNQIDDDGDGQIDCKDSDCVTLEACKDKPTPENCTNQKDDDGDGQVDCDDPDCMDVAGCKNKCDVATQTACGTTCCNNATQNCVAGTCQPKVVAENCTNTLDDDGDGKADCDDPDCAAHEICQDPVEICDNGNVDDDGDLRADCEDPDCFTDANCVVTCAAEGETLCGRDCCTNATETCVANSCVGNTVEGCLIPSAIGSVSVTGEASYDEANGITSMSGNLPSADETVDMIKIELYEGVGFFANGLRTGTFTLTGDELNYKTCSLCVRLHGDFVDGEGPTADYLATGGTVQLASVQGKLVATVTAGTFQHVTIAWPPGDYSSTPHADGCTTSIEKALFDGTFPPVEICDNGTDDDGDGKADCEDSDCGSDDACIGDPCQPLTPVCPEGNGCYAYSATEYFCGPAGTTPTFGSCSSGNDCMAGSDCFSTSTSSFCLPYCNPADATTCPGTCHDLGDGTGACVPETQACDPIAPTACASHEACYPTDETEEGFGCYPAGTVTEGGSCQYADDCAANLFCVGGTCRLVCDPANPVCNGTMECQAFSDVPTVGACYEPPCNPLLPNACPSGEACYWDSAAEEFACMSEGGTPIGGACGDADGECVPGAECINDNGVTTCMALCDPTASSCTAPESCLELGDGLGICTVVEDCTTPGDEDGNGFADCDDPYCRTDAACVAQFCSAAIELTESVASGDTSTAANHMKGSCGGNGKDVIYTVSAGNAGETGVLLIRVTAPFDTVVYARSNCADSTTELGCVDDYYGSATNQKTELLAIENYAGGTPVTVFVDGYSSSFAGGTYDLSVTFEIPACGNGTVEYGETCDDGNAVAADGCGDTCAVETGYACPSSGGACHVIACGDGFVDGTEKCDDANTTAGDGCSDACAVEAGFVCPTAGQACREITCGDGFVDGSEKCDDTNATAGDGCSDSCTIEDGFVCETAGQACRPIVCGDGFKDGAEKCDDANPDAGDGCSDTCTIEPGYVCETVGQACRATVCGDGTLEGDEECEPITGSEATDGCSDTCKNAPVEIAVSYADPFSGSIAVGGTDWVRIEATADSSLDAVLSGGCAGVGSKLALHDIEGNLIVKAADYCASLHIPHLSAGSYLLSIAPYFAEDALTYNLSVTFGAVESCGALASYDPVTLSGGMAEILYEEFFGMEFEVGVGGSFNLNADPDKLMVELYDGYGVFADGIVPGTYDLTGDELSYSTCGACVFIVDEQGRMYFATGGSVEITSAQGNLTGSISNVTFSEVLYGMSVPNACSSAITSASFDAPIAAKK